MQIDTFNSLLKIRNPLAKAYVPEKVGKRRLKVNVIYTANSKVYGYNGTILSVAKRLGLIPGIDVEAESKQAIIDLKATGQAIAYIECADTINYYLDMPGKIASEVSREVDEYGLEVATFEIVKSEWI